MSIQDSVRISNLEERVSKLEQSVEKLLASVENRRSETEETPEIVPPVEQRPVLSRKRG